MPATGGLVIDAFAALVPGGGIGRFVRQLSLALRTRPDAPLARYAVTRELREAAARQYGREEIVTIPLAWRELAVAMMLSAKVGGRFDALYGHPAVVHSPLGYGPRFRGARLINHVHDITYHTHPQWHTFKTGALLNTTAPVACRDATLVLTDCEFVRQQVIDIFGAAPERVRSIPLALDPDFRPGSLAESKAHVRSRFGWEGEFLLHVGTLEPRKNHIRMVEAFEHMRRAGFTGQLVFVGKDGWRMGPILARIEASPERHAIHRVPNADDHDLIALYRACLFTLFPSHSEGFGYPLLESMACGRACVISDHPALLELAAGAAPAVPAEDVGLLAATMIHLWQDPVAREHYEDLGERRAGQYEFRHWADQMFEVYRSELAAALTS